MLPTDEYLIKQAQIGSLIAFETLVKKYQRKVVAFSRRFVKDHQDAEDVTQETFVAIFINLKKIDPRLPFTTFMFEIAKNKSLNLLRKKKWLTRLSKHMSVDHEEKWLDEITKAHSLKIVARGMDSLKPKYQRILKLFYFQRLDYMTISQKLNIPLNSVRTILRRAKISLRENI